MTTRLSTLLLFLVAAIAVTWTPSRAERYPHAGSTLARDPGAGWFHGQAPVINPPTLDILTHYGNGPNTYQFVRSNPVNWRDPSGLSTWDEDIDDFIGGYERNVRGTQNFLDFVQRQIARGHFLSMAYTNAAFAWDDFVWNRDEAILFDLIGGPFFSSICFDGNTLVLMADGTYSPIKQIRIGDCVACDEDPEARNGSEVCEVTRTFQRRTTKLLTLKVKTQDGTATVLVTPDHPFYSHDKATWIPAHQLRSGEWLMAATGNPEITSITGYSNQSTVFNLEVVPASTYFVSPANLLVHNTCQLVFPAGTRQSAKAGSWPAALSRDGQRIYLRSHHAAALEDAAEGAATYSGLQSGWVEVDEAGNLISATWEKAW